MFYVRKVFDIGFYLLFQFFCIAEMLFCSDKAFYLNSYCISVQVTIEVRNMYLYCCTGSANGRVIADIQYCVE